MERILDNWYSDSLREEMPIAQYGTTGRALLMFPSAAADYLEYERFYLIDSIKHHIESGKIRCFSINSINSQSWLNSEIEPRQKAIRHQEFNKYIESEVVPYINDKLGDGAGNIFTFGVSFGALHAVNTLLRKPELFAGALGMSGVYDLKDYSKGYFDEDVYYNSPADYMPRLEDENILAKLRKKMVYFYTGSGEYEDPSGSWKMAEILGSKQIPNYVECWDHTWRHDWPTWREMLPQAIEKYL
ncbi:MAG TPA: alpha/beta hydrolase-fold protein [Candidatus Kapabacteria bacterium]|nr:alpha/beta hydrolase-fold protein [Candidatus Kapabacteria bacterium]